MANNEEKLVLRADRKMFMGVVESNTTTYTRMRGFSSLSESKNPTEYSVKYVDEKMETTRITGVSSSYDFTFDLLSPNDVLTDLAGIIDDEVIGTDAEREFISVDFHKPATGGGFEAVKRKYSVIGSTVADGTDALNYNGTLKASGGMVKGVATISTPENGNSDNVQTITFVENTTENVIE